MMIIQNYGGWGGKYTEVDNHRRKIMKIKINDEISWKSRVSPLQRNKRKSSNLPKKVLQLFTRLLDDRKQNKHNLYVSFLRQTHENLVAFIISAMNRVKSKSERDDDKSRTNIQRNSFLSLLLLSILLLIYVEINPTEIKVLDLFPQKTFFSLSDALWYLWYVSKVNCIVCYWLMLPVMLPGILKISLAHFLFSYVCCCCSLSVSVHSHSHSHTYAQHTYVDKRTPAEPSKSTLFVHTLSMFESDQVKKR